jgi:oxepin-CoA hydrolase/3-oxo-5,6-dehydrosuberyl-CoA semialdehyde dehydrogenase
MLKIVENYACGKWIRSKGSLQPLFSAVDGSVIGETGTEGLPFGEMLEYARSVGNPALRSLSFQERGRMLKALALYLQERKEEFYTISYLTGATRADSWIDIEGGIGNLFSYASLRKQFLDLPYCMDGSAVGLGKEGKFIGQHLLIPKTGVAIHINAFNFPVWGMLEKIAVNFLAGVPAVVKPATLTCYLTEAVVRSIIQSGILPAGALQLICGSAGNLLDYVTDQDVVTFTGSAETGRKLKTHPALVANSVPFNMEADSLNSMVLGEDAEPGTPEWDLFIKEVRKEMTAKAGQKCTAVRRVFVPDRLMEEVWRQLGSALDKTVIGRPDHAQVRMGPLAGEAQRKEVKQRLQDLLSETTMVYGRTDHLEVLDANAEAGAFFSPVLLTAADGWRSSLVHEVEVFGPVATILPYKNLGEAVQFARMGKGSLVSSIVTNKEDIAREFILGAGTHHGRMLILNRESAAENTGHGSPLPLLVHGGPGRAGGGEEMGGVRGVKHYMQRVAVQGAPSMITAVSGSYKTGAPVLLEEKHPFRKYFEELQIGDALETHQRTITEADIVNFGNLSWDHFYAHTDHTSLEGTLFEKPVAHGYFILSAAAGLFVDPKKGPVMLNYGLEECRFLKPVYAGSTIGVRLICKEKLKQDRRTPEELKRGIVKWQVEVKDETGDMVAIATILTMVQCRQQED